MSEEKDIVERLVDGVVWSDRGRNMGPDEIDEAATDAIMNDAASEITRLRGEVERLTGREADLLSANNRYLMRARDAEAVLADLLKFASGVETTAAYPTFQRARAILSSAPKPGEG